MYNEELRDKYMSLQESINYKKNLLDEELNKALIKFQNSCNHKDINGNFTLEYDSNYEMRNSDMYCTQCGKHGTRKELEGINIIVK